MSKLVTTDDKLEYLLSFQDKQTMRNYRMLARIDVLEVMLRKEVPESKLKQWEHSLESGFQIALQKKLEECEKISPGYSALIDDREPWELKLLA